MKIKRLIYFGYYLRNLDKKKLKRFLDVSSKDSNKSKLFLLLQSFICTFKYNISILEFFQYRFYRLKEYERKEWAGTGFMFEYQKIMNPLENREILENKIKFLNAYKKFVKRKYADIIQLQNDVNLSSELIQNLTGKLVIKASHGQTGNQVKVIECKDISRIELIEKLKELKFDLVEEYVVQHPDLMRLSPSGLNTIRIFTQLHDGKVDFLGARLRITINSAVDNMAAGNPAAPINIENGIVCGPAVFSDISKEDVDIHPVTGVKINGFQIPFWKEVIDMTEKAALLFTKNQSIGWDIAITSKGPELIEGNHNWCKLLWQLPVKKGLKKNLSIYLKNGKTINLYKTSF